MKLQETSTWSKVGFAFLILFVVSFVCVYSEYQKIVESIENDNKLPNDNYDLLKILLANNWHMPNNIMIANTEVIPNNKVITIPTAPNQSSSDETELASEFPINNSV